jgi:LacI family kdg operon repressor
MANKVTIDQVAEICGVSKTTISRYLNHKYENISAETRQRIEQVITDLNYRPNRTAQRLKASRSMLIGCCIGDIASPFAGLLLKGITGTCEAAGYQVLFADSKENPFREQRAIEGFLENRVDGLIVNSAGGNDEYLIDVQNERGVPVVLADRSLRTPGRLDTVISEYHKSITDCVLLMLQYGYRKIAFFTESIRSVMPRIQRRDSFFNAFSGRRDGAEPLLYEFSVEKDGDCLQCITDFVRKYPGERIAILSVNGVTAIHILRAMQQAGITPGYDFGLCTFDDWGWFSLMSPGITAIRQETELLGSRAAELLLERLRGERLAEGPAVSIELPTTFMLRGSLVKEKA